MTQHSNLDAILSEGEGQTIESKRSLSLQKEAVLSPTAMVNAEPAHGMIVFGIQPDKPPFQSICGIEQGNLDSAQRKIARHVDQYVQPRLQVVIVVQEYEGKHVLLLKAKRFSDVPYHEYNNKAYIREGTTNRPLYLAEKQGLSKIGNRNNWHGPWQCASCRTIFPKVYTHPTDSSKRSYLCSACTGELWPYSQPAT